MYVLLDNSIKGIYFSCMYSIIMYVYVVICWTTVCGCDLVVIWLFMLPPMFSSYRINWRQQRTWLLVTYKEMTFNTSKRFCTSVCVCVCVCAWSCVCACMHGRVCVHVCMVVCVCMCSLHVCVNVCTVYTHACMQRCHLDMHIYVHVHFFGYECLCEFMQNMFTV